MNMKDYINAFDHLNNRLIDMKLPNGVLAFRLLIGANLSATEKLATATIKTLIYKDMSTQLKTILVISRQSAV